MVPNMKKLEIYFLGLGIIVITMLSSCAQSGSSSNAVNCSAGREVCISIDKVQPFTMGEPMLMNISIHSEKNFSVLHASLQTFSGVTVDGPQTWRIFSPLPKTNQDWHIGILL